MRIKFDEIAERMKRISHFRDIKPEDLIRIIRAGKIKKYSPQEIERKKLEAMERRKRKLQKSWMQCYVEITIVSVNCAIEYIKKRTP